MNSANIFNIPNRTTKHNFDLLYHFNISSTNNKHNFDFVPDLQYLTWLFDPKLTLIPQTDLVIGRAYRMLGFFIRCSKEFKDPYTVKQLYTTYVRPILEYASEVWCPYYGVHKKRIESIQKKFLKYEILVGKAVTCYHHTKVDWNS